MSPFRRTRALAPAAAVVGILLLAGCTSASGSATPTPTLAASKQADIDAALQAGGKLDFWAWGAQYPKLVEAFEAEYPNVDVELLNNGSVEQTKKLQNVLAAGTGIPDVVQTDLTTIPQWAFVDAYADLGSYGLDLRDTFTPSSVDAVTFNGKEVAFPMDAGPLVMFYRPDLFQAAGVDIPTTWDEFLDDARAIQKNDPTKFIGVDAGGVGDALGYIAQAGGQPFKVDGNNITIDFSDSGTQKWENLWSTLLDENLIDTSIGAFSPEWTTAMSEGKYATWVTGAWAVGSLTNRFPESAGLWQAAPPPAWEAGDESSGNAGGSGVAVMKKSDTDLLAVGFAQWITSSEKANQVWVDNAGVPTTLSMLSSDAWLNNEYAYFGGQKVNQVIADSLANVNSIQSLPYQAYAYTLWSDDVAPAYRHEIPLSDGMAAWQDSLIQYGNEQGFTVK
jgi:multiple sugar transport system substrate-binding protein